MSRKLQDKQQRRLAEERRRQEQQRQARRRNFVTLGVIALVAVTVVALIVNERRAESGPVGVAEGEATCTDIERPPVEGSAAHVDDGTDVQYSTAPPTSGDHWDIPAEPGFYDVASGAQLPEERLVHNLEHGQIVFWYDPDNEEVQDDLESLIDDQPTKYSLTLLAVPSSAVEAPNGFTMTAWGAMQSCDEVSESVINDFRAEFQGRGPESVREIPPFTEDNA